MTDATPQNPPDEARIRLTVDLPRSVHRQLKQAALDTDQTLSDVVRCALSDWLAQRR